MRIRADVMALALAFGLGLAAQADDAPDCAALASSLSAIEGYEATVPPAGPDKGWCVLDGATLRSKLARWPNFSAERLRVRATATEVQVDLRGLRVAPRPGDREVDERLRSLMRLQTADLRFLAVRDPVAGTLTLSGAELDLSGGTKLRLSAEILGADLTLASIPLGAVTRAKVEWRNDGRFLRPVMELAGQEAAGATGGAAVDAARAALAEVVAALPAGAVDDDTRKALEAVVAALPQGRGKLELTLASPGGIGAARVAVASLQDDPVSPEALASLLEGAVITARWESGLAP